MTVVPIHLAADELEAILTKTDIAKTKKLRPRLEAMAAEDKTIELDINDWSRVVLALCGPSAREVRAGSICLGLLPELPTIWPRRWELMARPCRLNRTHSAIPMPETLKGLIERVTYHNPENGFAVLKVVVKGRQDLVPSWAAPRRCRQANTSRPLANGSLTGNTGNSSRPTNSRPPTRPRLRASSEYLGIWGDPQHRAEAGGQDRQHLQRADPGDLRDGPRLPPAHQGNRLTNELSGSGKAGRSRRKFARSCSS